MSCKIQTNQTASRIVIISVITEGFPHELGMAELSSPSAAKGYIPIEHAVAGPGINLELGAESLYAGCQCLRVCELQSDCTCVSPYDETGHLKDAYFLTHSVPIFECNSRCTCDSSCLNRVTQRQPLKLLKLFQTENKGLGVCTEGDIQKGTFVGEYVGEVVSSMQAKDRLQSLTKDDPCYIVNYKEHTNDGRVLTTNIDATFKGNVMRFVNHSCSPNLAMLPLRTDSIVPRLCLFASENILAGEELCFSYFGSSGSIDSRVNTGRKRCYCGSKECIGFLPLEL